MTQLIAVEGPNRDNTEKVLRVQWNMGNKCNFSCAYCPPMLHDGTRPWQDLDLYIKTVEKICTHYNELGRRVDFELIGGEVTVMPGFEKVLKKMAEYDTRCRVYTNASRTVRWWAEAADYLDSLMITWHPESLDEEHLFEVIRVLKDDVLMDFNIAGVGGQVEYLGEVVDRIRQEFVGCEIQNEYSVSVCVKTMYSKYLGKDSKQETYYAYTDKEQEVINRPGIKPKPAPPQEPKGENEDNSHKSGTRFLWSDGREEYVQSHLISEKGLNNFKGMKCELGFDSIVITATGDVLSSWCGARPLGNITQIEDWSFPKTETVCPFDYCNNINDIAITKRA